MGRSWRVFPCRSTSRVASILTRRCTQARLVHARRRPGPRKRAKRLKVFAAHKSDRPLVGVALLPREAGADAAAAAEKLGELCFGGSLRFHWAAGDGTSGLRAQRLRSAAMALYDSWDRLDASSLRSLRACVHPGGRPVVGADAALRSWDDLFGGAIRRRALMPVPLQKSSASCASAGRSASTGPPATARPVYGRSDYGARRWRSTSRGTGSTRLP